MGERFAEKALELMAAAELKIELTNVAD